MQKKSPDLHTESKEDFSFVERIPDELRFLKRYLSLHNKKKSKDDLLRFINALHRSIIEKKIRKTSVYAKQINYIQDKLVNTYNNMTIPVFMQLSDKTMAEFKSLIHSEKAMPSVMLIKRYISLNGKYGVKDKAKQLMEAMKRAADKKKILRSDKYISVLDRMHENLKTYVNSKKQNILSIEQTELNGLNGFLSGFDESESTSLNGLDEGANENGKVIPMNAHDRDHKIMSSADFRNLKFKTLGFSGRWRAFIGDPSKGFTAMVFGKPKFGKSYLCIDFADYLAENFGKVLYIAKEEGLDMTLQEKIIEKDIDNANLDVTGEIPEDLSNYDFIFLDSVNKLALSAKDLESLKKAYPDKSFIYIFQTTKEGNFRGANEFQHDVDIVIEVPEVGKATQRGRFNQGGEKQIFDNQEYKAAA